MVFWKPKRSDEDFSDEIRAHIQLEADRLVEEGMNRDDAFHAARRAFGNVGLQQERFYRSNRWMWLDHVIRDVRYGLRSLRRDLGLFTFATLIVGLGIGATATVFSVASALLLRPLPFTNPEQLVWISNGEWGRGQQLSQLSVQVSHLVDLKTDNRLLTDVAGYYLFDREGDRTLTGAGDPERVTRLQVTQNFFPLLGIEPMLGRLFSDEESQFGGPPVALLTNGLWTRRFGADTSVVGRSMTIDDAPITIIGVLPPTFDFSAIFQPGHPIDYIAPFPLSPETNRRGNTLALVGRLAPGATIEAAQAEAMMLAARPTAERRNDFVPRVRPLHEHISGRFRAAMVVLAGAVGLVMLIVCANLSNLLLARGATREKEIAVRAALGASRRRLVQQMLTESLVLTSAGAGLGLFLAVVGTRVLAGLGIGIPLLTQVRVDGAAVGFTMIAAVGTGLVLGVTPALRLSASEFHETLKESTRSASTGTRHRSLRSTLVMSEVALACVLLVGAGLLLRSFAKLTDVSLGFEPTRAVTVRIDPATRFATPELRVAYFNDALRSVRAAGGVESAGLTDVLPTAFNRRWCVYGTECAVIPFIRVVSDGYLDAMGLTLVSGRDFSSRDIRGTSPVIIVNEALAEQMWPEQDPLGRTVPFGHTDWPEWEVIGVVRGMRHLSPDQAPGAEIFFPIRQMRDYGAVHLIVRGNQSLAALTTSVRNALIEHNPNVPANEFRVIQEIVNESISPRRFITLLLAGFAGFALVLASLGIYAVVSYSVTQRRREIGIRLALGAPALVLQKRIVSQSVKLTLVGTLLGLAGAVVLSRLIESLLFGVATLDPLTYVVVPTVLTLVAMLAGYLPARRASMVAPTEVLNPQYRDS